MEHMGLDLTHVFKRSHWELFGKCIHVYVHEWQQVDELAGYVCGPNGRNKVVLVDAEIRRFL